MMDGQTDVCMLLMRLRLEAPPRPRDQQHKAHRRLTALQWRADVVGGALPVPIRWPISLVRYSTYISLVCSLIAQSTNRNEKRHSILIIMFLSPPSVVAHVTTRHLIPAFPGSGTIPTIVPATCGGVGSVHAVHVRGHIVSGHRCDGVPSGRSADRAREIRIRSVIPDVVPTLISRREIHAQNPELSSDDSAVSSTH